MLMVSTFANLVVTLFKQRLPNDNPPLMNLGLQDFAWRVSDIAFFITDFADFYCFLYGFA